MRVALATPFSPHYRRPLFAEMDGRMDLTLILTTRGKEPYWHGARPLDTGEVSTVLAPGPLPVRRALRNGGFDAVIAGLTGRATLISVVRTARELGLPLVLWVGIWEHPRTLAHRLSRPFARRLYRSADAVVTYGTHVSDFIARESGRVDNVFIAAQAMENERFRAPVPRSEIRILRERLGLDDRSTFTFVGRITEEKGLDVLMRASARVEAPHQVVVAGTGPLMEETEALASSLGIGERVHFVGYVDQAQLPALLQASDVLVMPSVTTKRFKEPWGFVVNEAMNSGLPVIASDAVGAAAGGLLLDRGTGLVTAERDVNGLAGAMEELIVNDARRRSMGEAARMRVLEWNYGAAADAFEAALAAVTTGPRGAGSDPHRDAERSMAPGAASNRGVD